MTILVTGSTGAVGSRCRPVCRVRAQSYAPWRVRRKRPEFQPASPRSAASSATSTPSARPWPGWAPLSLLVPNLADELTQALLTLSVAREAGVKGLDEDSGHHLPCSAPRRTDAEVWPPSWKYSFARLGSWRRPSRF